LNGETFYEVCGVSQLELFLFAFGASERKLKLVNIDSKVARFKEC